MNKTGLGASSIGNYIGLSPVTISAAGSSGGSDLSAFGWMNVAVVADSSDLSVYIQRSGTSNGTYASIGSMSAAASKLVVRGFELGSSAVWYRAAYVPDGNTLATITFAATGARRTPVTVDGNVTVLSDVINA